MFKPAAMMQAYLKAGILGFPGSGKSFTTMLLAVGLVNYVEKVTGKRPPVFYLDTENGLDFLADRYKEAKVDLQTAKTRAFVDLVDAVKQAEKAGAILAIDSVTHFWQEVQQAYKLAKGRSQLRFSDWGPIKATWQEYTDLFVNSKVHIVMAGRAGDVFENYVDDEGNKQIEKVGTKMQAEKNMGYEPSLGIEMERVTKADFRKGERNAINRCFIIKDRFDLLDGKSFDNPTFEAFLPHIERLKIGGEHTGIDVSRSSQAVFQNKDHELNRAEQQRQRDIAIEELEGELLSAYPGQSAEEKKARTDLVAEAFGTRSKEALRDLEAAKLKAGVELIRAKIRAKQQPAATAGKEAAPAKEKAAAGRK